MTDVGKMWILKPKGNTGLRGSPNAFFDTITRLHWIRSPKKLCLQRKTESYKYSWRVTRIPTVEAFHYCLKWWQDLWLLKQWWRDQDHLRIHRNRPWQPNPSVFRIMIGGWLWRLTWEGYGRLSWESNLRSPKYRSANHFTVTFSNETLKSSNVFIIGWIS